MSLGGFYDISLSSLMNLMEYLLKTKIAGAVVGLFAVVLAAARLSASYRVDLLSSSLTGVWVAVQLIIVIVWKLSDDSTIRRPREEEKPLTSSIPDLEIRAAVPIDRKPSSEFWREIPQIAPESESIVSDSVQKPGDPPPPTGIESGNEEPTRVSPRVEIEKTEEPEMVTEENESIDATWRAIVEGGASPVRRFLRKSDTWEGSPEVDAPEISPGRPVMRKSATFREAASPAAEVRRRGRDLVGRGDELHGRAENFIKMHYDCLRLQREESEQRRFLKMANRAY